MTLRDDFEFVLASITSAPVESASGKRQKAKAISGSNNHIDDIEIFRLLKEAEERLKKDPSLFSGDPEGVFTFDDPVLAVGAYYFQFAARYADMIGFAGGDGKELRNSAFWEWSKVGLKAVISHKDESFIELAAMVPQEPIVIQEERLRIAVVGDAGYQCQAQANVIYDIIARHSKEPFDLIIHLGDVYFAGSGIEMLKNFLGPFNLIGPRILTIPGNHDLYFGGDAFISAINVLRQPGRFFCIETPNWRILGLDTALGAQSIFRNEGRLDTAQVKWLDNILMKQDNKKLILMSHHYIVSGWEKISTSLKRQMKDRILKNDKIFAWYWGHEHTCATYEKRDVGFYGACVGNGAFLNEWQLPGRNPQPSWYSKSRCSCYQDKSKFGAHGYLELDLHPDRVIETFHLENNEIYIRELNIE